MILQSLFLVCSLFLVSSDAASGPRVALTSGTFAGVSSKANGTDKWLGVPFAQPPTGSLRFKAPVAITNPSKAVRQANQFGSACPQEPSDSLGAPLAEDCLFLNVRQTRSSSYVNIMQALIRKTGMETHRNKQQRQTAGACLVLRESRSLI